MNIHIEHLTINIIQPQEPVQGKPAAPVFAERSPVRHGHRTPEEIQLKDKTAFQEHAAKLQHRLRIAERLRTLFGDDVANSVMAGGF